MNARSLVAEGLGTAALLTVVVGSGIMAETLSGGNTGRALLANAVATGLGLAVLIFALIEVSGAHFNPAVTLSMCLAGRLTWREAPAYVAVQLVGGVAGVLLAHAMFGEALLQWGIKPREGSHLLISEAVATFGLLFAIFAGVRRNPAAIPWLVGAYITAAYWFTASTSFANPAVTVARAFTNSFAGIGWPHVGGFVAAQLVGALLATGVCGWLLADRDEVERS